MIDNKDFFFFNGQLIIDERNKNKLNSKKNETKEITKYDEKICNVCKDKDINIVMKDCKHMFYCHNCITDDIRICPICKIRIKSFVRIYNKK